MASIDDLLRKLSTGAMSVLRIDTHGGKEAEVYKSVKEYQEELWRMHLEHPDDIDRVVNFAKRGVLAFPIEESYVLYEDICKVIREDASRYDWMLNFCIFLMYSYRATGKALSKPRYGSYLRRALHFCGLSQRRQDVLRACEESAGEDELREHLDKLWQDRRRPKEKHKPDPLIDVARQYVQRTGILDPQKLRYNVGMYAIGVNRACSLIDMLEDEGVIRPEDNPNWN